MRLHKQLHERGLRFFGSKFFHSDVEVSQVHKWGHELNIGLEICDFDDKIHLDSMLCSDEAIQGR